MGGAEVDSGVATGSRGFDESSGRLRGGILRWAGFPAGASFGGPNGPSQTDGRRGLCGGDDKSGYSRDGTPFCMKTVDAPEKLQTRFAGGYPRIRSRCNDASTRPCVTGWRGASSTRVVGPSSTNRPADITITRSVMARTTVGSCVMKR